MVSLKVFITSISVQDFYQRLILFLNKTYFAGYSGDNVPDKTEKMLEKVVKFFAET